MKTLDWIEARLAASGRAPGGRSDFDLNPQPGPAGMAKPDHQLTRAAVLIPLVNHPGGVTVMLTKRTDHLFDHPGQVSFPGGRQEDRDETPVATALRETHEEVGLAPERISVAGTLDIYRTVTGFHVTPVVGIVEPGFELDPDPFEVAEVFEISLDMVLDPANHQRQSRVWKGMERFYYVLPHDDYFIWGATAGMLVNLAERLNAADGIGGGR